MGNHLKRNWNWLLYGGLLLAVLAFVSYYAFFIRFPITRDVPWLNLLLFGAAMGLLGVGLRRAYSQPERYRGKVAGPVVTVLSLAILGFFLYLNVYFSRQIPASAGAPRVGQPAPEFTLPDTSGNSVSLAALLQTPAAAATNIGAAERGVLLIFYRGYW